MLFLFHFHLQFAVALKRIWLDWLEMHVSYKACSSFRQLKTFPVLGIYDETSHLFSVLWCGLVWFCLKSVSLVFEPIKCFQTKQNKAAFI